MGQPDCSRFQFPGSLRQTRGRSQRRARDFQQHLRLQRKRPAQSHQSSPGRHVQSRSKLEQILAILILGTDKNRNCEGQALPIAAFRIRLSSIQVTFLNRRVNSRISRTLWAKLARFRAKQRHLRASKPPLRPSNKPLSRHLFRLTFVSHGSETRCHLSGVGTFDCILLPIGGNSLVFSVDREKTLS